MKVFASGLLVLLVLGLAVQAAPARSQDKTREIKAQIVSVDVDKHTVTYKVDGEDEPATSPAVGKALENLKDLKAGDKVMLICQDGQDGQPESIIEIKPLKSPSDM